MDWLIKRVIREIENRAEKDWPDLIDGNDIIPDEEAFVDSAVNVVMHQEDFNEMLLEYVADHPEVKKAVCEAAIVVREMALDNAAYRRDPLGYHGMSMKDFV